MIADNDEDQLTNENDIDRDIELEIERLCPIVNDDWRGRPKLNEGLVLPEKGQNIDASILNVPTKDGRGFRFDKKSKEKEAKAKASRQERELKVQLIEDLTKDPCEPLALRNVSQHQMKMLLKYWRNFNTIKNWFDVDRLKGAIKRALKEEKVRNKDYDLLDTFLQEQWIADGSPELDWTEEEDKIVELE